MTREQLYAFNRICNEIPKIPEVDRQWLPLIRRGLWHWLNVLGQHFFFSKSENSIIRDAARREVELLILPLNRDISTTYELAAKAVIHAFPFWFFIVLDNQSDAAKQFKATRRNYPSFYDSWVYIHWQIRIAQRCFSLLRERIHANPVALNTICFFVEESKTSYKFLNNLIMKKIKFGIPVDEKESLVNHLLGEWIAKLWEMPVSKVYHEAFYTDTVILRDVANHIKKTSTKQWQSMINLDDIEEPKAPESKPTPNFDDTQRKLLNRAYGKSAAKVIEVYLNDPDATIPEIAKQTGISERTVKSIRAQMRKKGKEKFLDLI